MKLKKEEIQALDKIYQIDTANDYKGIIKLFNSYIDVVCKQLQFFDGHVTNIYRTKYETLLFKLMMSCSSLSELLNGTTIQTNIYDELVKQIDISTCKVVARSIYENHLTLFYLFNEINDDEEAVIFRNIIYDLASIIKRQESKTTNPLHLKKKESEKQLMIKLKKVLQDNIYFQELDSKTQTHILNCSQSWKFNSKLRNWTQLFNDSDLVESLFQTYWTVYSAYAHSESLSVIQLEDYIGNDDAIKNFKYQIVKTTIMILCNQIIKNNEYREELKIIFESQGKVLQAEIELWKLLSTGKNLRN